MRHERLTEAQARQRVADERRWRDPGPPTPARVVIAFHPFHERSPEFAAIAGHHPATWEAIWTDATEGGEPNMAHIRGRFESHDESPREAIDWAVERCDNVWISALGTAAAVPLEEYLAGS
ncbi:hypothetical protein GCM10009839_18370 [Catenulispora yoronensis]|uniref:Uncharacterized protein n=2 Tax=Catenulispora yoronensis TaxID=450799 RepID=A0ABN2TTZ7_9ACTN